MKIELKPNLVNKPVSLKKKPFVWSDLKQIKKASGTNKARESMMLRQHQQASTCSQTLKVPQIRKTPNQNTKRLGCDQKSEKTYFKPTVQGLKSTQIRECSWPLTTN